MKGRSALRPKASKASKGTSKGGKAPVFDLEDDSEAEDEFKPDDAMSLVDASDIDSLAADDSDEEPLMVASARLKKVSAPKAPKHARGKKTFTHEEKIEKRRRMARYAHIEDKWERKRAMNRERAEQQQPEVVAVGEHLRLHLGLPVDHHHRAPARREGVGPLAHEVIGPVLQAIGHRRIPGVQVADQRRLMNLTPTSQDRRHDRHADAAADVPHHVVGGGRVGQPLRPDRGQRQRLLIARALISKPRLIFFDEATSALDNKAQAVFTQSMDRLDATRIVIAHRLSTVVNADRILYLEGGQIREQGSYQELLARGGLFAQLARRQMA